MTLARFAVLCVPLLVACGSKTNEVCPSEKHRADPDGRGERCIDDRSTCDAASECSSDDACCTSTCADPSGGGVYACTEQCRVPDCTEGSCGDGWRCQGAPNDACTAYCVPVDVECADGTIPADPTGSGTFVCVPVESTCLRPADCPGTVDGCCTGACREQESGAWACEQDCGGAGEAMWECTTDPDCEAMMGPGWTCAQSQCGGNECLPPAPECDGDEDCVLAIDSMDCCGGCPLAYSLTEAAANECLVVQTGPAGDREGAPAPPEDPMICEPICTDVMCPAIECMPPTRAACSSGQCVPAYE